jgi:hypothetical protein
LARRYTELLAGADLRLPAARPDVTHVYHQYVIRSARRDALQAHLRSLGIGTLIHYPVPVHAQPAYAGRIAIGAGLPETDAAAGEILSLPIFPELGAEDADRVAEAIVGFAG